MRASVLARRRPLVDSEVLLRVAVRLARSSALVPTKPQHSATTSSPRESDRPQATPCLAIERQTLSTLTCRLKRKAKPPARQNQSTNPLLPSPQLPTERVPRAHRRSRSGKHRWQYPESQKK